MPFSNRDKPRLSERLRGKSSQEFIDEINSAFGSRSPRMLFDTPQWSTRANFPRVRICVFLLVFHFTPLL